MIIRSLLRRPGALQSITTTPARIFSPLPSRCLHTVPTLQDHEYLRKHGVKNLFSPKAFNIAWDQYQEYLVKDLNQLTSGEPEENMKVQDLVIKWARDPMRAYYFNIASTAFNNHFFFSGINTNPEIKPEPTSELMSMIRSDFTSLESLRVEFLTTADAMFGPGFVWLVQVKDHQTSGLRILPTYLGGSPLSGAHYRQQSNDLTTHNVESYQQLNAVGKFGKAAQNAASQGARKPLGGVDVTPLLCVNTWEHVWLHDFKIGGKLKFLEAWWEKINWDFVQARASFPSSSRNPQYNDFV